MILSLYFPRLLIYAQSILGLIEIIFLKFLILFLEVDITIENTSMLFSSIYFSISGTVMYSIFSFEL